MTAPRPVVEPNTWDFLREPMIAPTGFREYDARWKYPDDINLPGVTALGLGLVAGIAENSWLPIGLSGVIALVLMASVSHVGGQGLLAFALGHLSAAFSSLVIFLEALAAAFFGWLVFGETLGPWQIAGGAAILAGIGIARPRDASPDE